MAAAVKQLDAQFLLQLHELTGEGGLSDMQQLSGTGDILLARRHQKIAQYAKFHGSSSFISKKNCKAPLTRSLQFNTVKTAC